MFKLIDDFYLEELSLQTSDNLESYRLQTANRLSMDLRDVYLGGSCYLRTNWRQKLAIPYLKSKGITYHLPTLHETTQKDKSEEEETDQSEEEETNNKNSSIETDKALSKNMYNPVLLETSRILLFVISDETRSLAPMTLAAHCIGLMYNVVLVVQMLPDDSVIGNDKVILFTNFTRR